MWFLFGFITLISFTGYFIYKRIDSSWKGISAYTTDKQPFQYQKNHHKNKLQSLLISVAAPVGYDFIIKREGVLESLAKGLGISKEVQIGVEEFDSHVYVASDDELFHQVLASHEGVRAALLEIVRYLNNGYNFRSMRCNGGRLWVKLKPGKDIGVADMGSEFVELVGYLHRVANALPDTPPAGRERWRDPFVLKAALLLALCTALFINGMVHSARLVYTTQPSLVDVSPVVRDALMLGGAIVFFMVVALFALLGRSARTHLVLIEIFTIGAVGAVSSSFVELRDMNMEFDSGPAYQTTVIAESVRTRKGHRRTPPAYFVTVRPVQGDSYRRVEYEITSHLYGRIRPGDRLIITEKSGYLNYRWVFKIEK